MQMNGNQWIILLSLLDCYYHYYRITFLSMREIVCVLIFSSSFPGTNNARETSISRKRFEISLRKQHVSGSTSHLQHFTLIIIYYWRQPIKPISAKSMYTAMILRCDPLCGYSMAFKVSRKVDKVKLQVFYWYLHLSHSIVH